MSNNARAGMPLQFSAAKWNELMKLLAASKKSSGNSAIPYRPVPDINPCLMPVLGNADVPIFGAFDPIQNAFQDSIADFFNRQLLSAGSPTLPGVVGIAIEKLVDGQFSDAVIDGIVPARIMLGRNPNDEMIRRATPVAGEHYLRGDTLGIYELLWHDSQQIDDPETTAEKGDIVWGLLRLGPPELPWVHVTPTLTSGKCEKNGDGYFPASYSMDSVTGSYSGDCMITFREAADPDMPIWGSHSLVGYIARWVEVDEQELPEIIVAEHPIKSVFGAWTASSGTSGTTGSIAVRRGATDLIDYDCPVESPFGAISNGKLVKADFYPGYGFMAVATEC